ncbi:MAG: DUF934 domain-containing protein [Alphaproteobacteria bacterium]|nr:MAG: DUF934 domain-containing protein [Alphaproteobacteria bacterium]
MALLRFREVPARNWLWLDDDQPLEKDANAVVSLARLEREGEALFAQGGAVAVRLASDEPAERLAPYVDRLAMIALDFPVFKDGRSFSNARILREHYGYQGELRAVGDVLADQIRFMLRCGFDSAELAERVSPAAAERALARYSVVYQAASDEAAPAHRLRRLAKNQAEWDVGL